MQSVATEFTPWASLIGGMLIGLSAVMIMLLFGRIAGISGITVQVMRPFAARRPDDWRWRAAFIAGLPAAPVLVRLSTGGVQQTVPDALGGMALARTAFRSSCTSGHGVCGLARLSRRSLVATATFMSAAVGTVIVLRHVIGGAS